MARLIKRAEAHYEAKDAEFGKVHVWRPERVVIECGCGHWPTLTGSVAACDGCGTDHAAVFRGGLIALPPRDDEAG